MNMHTGDYGARAIQRLQDDLEKYNQSNEKYARRMLWLTVAIVFLTVVMLGVGAIQVWLTIEMRRSSTPPPVSADGT